jgi:serine protease AprX
MRPDHEKNVGGVRWSALWGKTGRGHAATDSRRGELRSSALWGKGGRGVLAVFTLAIGLVLPAAGAAKSGSANSGSGHGSAVKASIPDRLLKQAQRRPSGVFNVIVQGKRGKTSSEVGQRVRGEKGKVKRSFKTITGVSANLSGTAILRLAKRSDILAITPDAPVASTYENAEMWRESTHVDQLWTATDPLTGLDMPAPQAPAIAIVDSGVDSTNLESFGGRVIASVNLSSLSPGADGDDQGHGTMVAGIAAGGSPLAPGVAPNAPIVSVRTSDGEGRSVTSDVIAAADWILANAKQYNIRVANFSLAGSVETSFRIDPLDKAVERLWFNDVVVVAAAGNHGSPDGPVSMSYAPANDPFIITVGALDQAQTSDPFDDTVPWWSGHGSTMDGFVKPDIAAPGRYLVMPVPVDATIPANVPDRVLAPGYMWMSGTSFAAPVVSGAAAQILARHPEWTADQVKGALMLTSAYLDAPGAGVGEIDVASAASLDFTPPNPNENFYAFVQIDANGQEYFNAASWASYVEANASWASASWASASWASASWASASWASASWNEASWSSDVESSMTSAASWNASAGAE